MRSKSTKAEVKILIGCKKNFFNRNELWETMRKGGKNIQVQSYTFCYLVSSKP